jgi:hypothetical protein
MTILFAALHESAIGHEREVLTRAANVGSLR